MKQRQAENCVFVEDAFEFKHLEGNRDLNFNHVKRIKKAIEEGISLPAIRVTDDENHYVIDGQHRYEAYKQLWEEGKNYEMLVNFYHSDNPFLDAITFNNTQMKWTLDTYMIAYAHSSKKVYYRPFIEFAIKNVDLVRSKKRGIPWDVFLALAGVSIDQAKKGLLFVSETTLNRMQTIIDKLHYTPLVFLRKESAKGFLKFYAQCDYDLETINKWFVAYCNEHSYSSYPTTRIEDWQDFFKKIELDYKNKV